MRDLDPEARRVLELARAARTPGVEDKARVARRLAGAIGAAAVATLPASAAGSAAATQSATGGTAAAQAATGGTAAAQAAAVGKAAIKAAANGTAAALSGAAKLWILAGALSAAALAGYAVSSQPAPARTKAPPLSAARISATPFAPTSTSTPAPTSTSTSTSTSTPTSVASPQPSSAVQTGAAPAAAVPAHTSLKPSDKSARPLSAPAANSDALDAELDLLHRAQLAWRERDAAGALRLLDEHRARYPRSQLQLERDTLRVLTLCELGQHAQATRLARSLLGRAASSPLRASLEESCALK
jgi:hypothetical protein